MKDQVTEVLLNPPTAVMAVGGVGFINTLIATLPLAINVATVVYLLVLISHKSWQFYREWKATHAPTE